MKGEKSPSCAACPPLVKGNSQLTTELDAGLAFKHQDQTKMTRLTAYLLSLCLLVAVCDGGLDDAYLSKVDMAFNSTLEHLYRCKACRTGLLFLFVHA